MTISISSQKFSMWFSLYTFKSYKNLMAVVCSFNLKAPIVERGFLSEIQLLFNIYPEALCTERLTQQGIVLLMHCF